MTHRTIITRRIDPPIGTKKFDWEATFASYDKGDPIGHGETEIHAIEDLLAGIDTLEENHK